MKIKDLYSLVTKVVLEEKNYFKEIVLKNEGDVVEYVRMQLYAGFIAEDGILYRETYRSKEYAEEKYSMNPSARGNVDLRYSGSFYSQMYLANNAIDYFRINSRVGYTDKLKGKYGDDIMALGGKYKTQFTEQLIRPQYLVKIKQELHLL